jgi:hypothetical protein
MSLSLLNVVMALPPGRLPSLGHVRPKYIQVPPLSAQRKCITYLQHLQLPDPLLDQLLYRPLLDYTLAIPKRIARSPSGVFAEVVGGELAALTEERAVLQDTC